MALIIPVGQWHIVKTLEFGLVIMVCKNGVFEPWRKEEILAF